LYAHSAESIRVRNDCSCTTRHPELEAKLLPMSESPTTRSRCKELLHPSQRKLKE